MLFLLYYNFGLFYLYISFISQNVRTINHFALFNKCKLAQGEHANQKKKSCVPFHFNAEHCIQILWSFVYAWLAYSALLINNGSCCLPASSCSITLIMWCFL
jgi:hypothetical protein